MLKDLLVHLDGGEEDEARIAHAAAIALPSNAHVTGLYTNPLPEYAYVLGIQSGIAPLGPVTDLEDKVHREGDLAVARLKERSARLGAPDEVRRLEAGLSELPRLCASEARWADLFVATTPYRDDVASGWDSLVEAVLFEAGHGIYLAPPGCKAKAAIRNILVAWRDTAESARAVTEALPFLKAAANTRIVTIDPPARSDRNEQAIDIAAHLDRHGAKVETVSAEAGDKSVAETLLREAHRMSADLIVMGAYGHSRFREWILGGTTREMITRSDLPLLMAH